MLDSLGTFFERAIPTGLAFVTGGTTAAITTAAGVERAKKQEKQLERAQFMYQNDPGLSSGQLGFNQSSLSSPGFFSPGGAFRTGVRDFGGFLSDFAPVASVFGLGSRFENVPPAGAQTINMQLPQETAQSGEITGASLGVAAPLVQGARGFLRSPGGQALFGGGAGLVAGSLMNGSEGKPRITRRMKSDVRKIYMMAGMNPAATAQILNNLGTYPRINFDANVVFFILTN